MMFASPHYDFRQVKRCLCLLVGAVVLLKVSMGFGAVILSMAVFNALSKKRPVEALFWVLFMTASSTGNHFVFSTNFVTVMTLRLTLMSLVVLVSAHITARGENRTAGLFLGLFAYLGWEALVSSQGYAPIVSYLKLFLFSTIFLSLFGLAGSVNDALWVDVRKLRAGILAVVIFMVIGSVLLIPFPSLGMMAVDEEMAKQMASGELVSLFRGMCAHSQALGPVMGVVGTFVFADMVFSIRKWDKLYIILILACPFLIYRTSSRTGMGTFIAGVGMTLFMLMQSRGVGQRWKNKVMSKAFTFGFFALVAVLILPNLRERIATYALKWGDREERQEVTVEGMFNSRQAKIEIEREGFARKPVTGNGFQVSAEMAHQKRQSFRDYLFAPVEKGVWVYAILEEGGAVGMSIWVGWLVCLFPRLYRRKSYVMAATFFAFFMSNTGEFSIFAMTYMGGFLWALTFAAGTLDIQRNKLEQRMMIG